MSRFDCSQRDYVPIMQADYTQKGAGMNWGHVLSNAGAASTRRTLLPGRRGQFGSSTALVTIALLAASTVPTRAQTTDWTGQFSSEWFLSGNWIGGFPRQTTDANIDTVTPNSTLITTPAHWPGTCPSA